MKHSFKLSKSNIIYASIVAIVMLFIKIRIYGFDAYSFGLSLGSFFAVIIIPTLLALLFWFILGRKEKGGTITFNIILTLMLFSSISEFGQMTKERQKPIDDLKEAVSKFKENTLSTPDSTDANYSELSTGIKKAIDDLLKTSIGEERKVFLVLKEFFKKSDSMNIEWTKAYNAFAEPRIFDFNRLNNSQEFEFQILIVQEYINQSNHLKSFAENRVEYLKNQTKGINKNNKAYKGFMRGMAKRDALQKPIFIPYINANIEYGQGIKEIIKLLEKEEGKWNYENETLTFDNSRTQITYERMLNNVISNEEIVGELSVKLVEIM